MTPFHPLARRLIATASACLLVTPTCAEIIGVEQFDYSDGSIAGKTGGTFWDYQNTSPAGHTGTASAWASELGTPVVTGGKLTTSDTQAIRRYNGANEAEGAINDANVAKAVYYRVTVTTGASLPGYMVVSSYDFGIEQIYFGKPSGSATFGIGSGGGETNTGPAIQPNTTYTLIAKLDHTANVVSLFVNPDLRFAEPAPTVTRAYTNTNWSTAIRLGSGNGGNPAAWDNLVVATTWADLGTIVTTTADEDDGILNGLVSLRDAVYYSPAGSLITFDPNLNGQTCTLSLGEMLIDRPLTIDASALSKGITIDAKHTSRHFFIEGSTASLTLRSLSLINGNGVGNGSYVGGAINLITGNLFLQHCTLSGNFAGDAGGIWLQGGGNSRLEECTLTGNRATENGGTGGIFIANGTCTLSRCTISGNTGTGGGGGLFLQTPANVSLGNCLIAGNTDSYGSDIVRAGGTLTASGNHLIGSNAFVEDIFPAGPLAGTQSDPLDPKLSPLGYYGGPVPTLHPLIGSPAIDTGGTTNPGGTDARGFSRFEDGDASFSSQLDIGAVEAASLLTVTTAVDENNGPTVGAGVSLREAIGIAAGTSRRIRFSPSQFPSTITLSLDELSIPATPGLFIDASNLTGPVTISGNPTSPSRVFNIPTTATIAMHSLRIVGGNAGDSPGGGISNSGTCTVMASTLSENSADAGGGITNFGTLAITHSTLSGNSAFIGGGIRNFGTLAITHSTLSGNSAFTGGGITNSGPLATTHSTLSGNNADFGGGGITSFAFNVSSLQLSSSIVSGNAAPTGPDIDGPSNISPGNLIGGNALLAPLGDYGGPTQTMPPLPGSPAIDAVTGSSRTTDQRGLPINGTPDLGAAEYQGNTDVRLFWNTDWDGDGNAFGIEFALGSNPRLSDPTHPKNLTFTINGGGQSVLNFGRNPAANSTTTWRVTRSTTLLPGSFSEIFRHNGPTDTTFHDGSVVITGNDFFQVLDTTTTPPGGKAFYRFEAISP